MSLKIDIPSRRHLAIRRRCRIHGHIGETTHILVDVCVASECGERFTAEVIGGSRGAGCTVCGEDSARCERGEGEGHGKGMEKSVVMHLGIWMVPWC